MAGNPLFRGVSFKLERGDRMTLAGRNGAGKTTLLRMLSGETGIDGGELMPREGHAGGPARPARAPGARPHAARLRAVRAAATSWPSRRTCTGSRARWPSAPTTARCSSATRARSRASSTPGAGTGACARSDRCTVSASPTSSSTGSSRPSRAASSPGHRLPGPWRRPGPAAAGRAHEPPRHHLARVARGVPRRTRLGRDSRGARPLVPGGGRHLSARARGWALALLPGLVARMAERGGRARDPARQADREAAGGDRPHGALHRALPLQGDQVAPGAVAREEARQDGAHRARSHDNRPLGFKFGGAERAGRVVLHMEDGRLEVPGRTLLDDGELWLERGEHVSLVGPNGAGKTTLIEALAGRRELDGGRLRTGHNVQLGYLSQHAEELGSSGNRAGGCPARHAPDPQQDARPARPLPVQRRGGREADGGLSGGERRRLSLAILVASGANVLILDEPTNHLDIDAREALEDALSGFDGNVLLVSHDRALLDAVGTRTISHGGRPAAQLSGRLGGVLARARRAPRRGARAPGAREARDREGEGGGEIEAETAAQSRPARRRTRSGGPPSWSARWRRRRPRCARSRTSWPTPPRGQARQAASGRRHGHAAAKKAVEEAYARWEDASK